MHQENYIVGKEVSGILIIRILNHFFFVVRKNTLLALEKAYYKLGEYLHLIIFRKLARI